ncbi:MAG: hypothetical protein ACLRMZ_00070 [Blautia marasmi]
MRMPGSIGLGWSTGGVPGVCLKGIAFAYSVTRIRASTTPGNMYGTTASVTYAQVLQQEGPWRRWPRLQMVWASSAGSGMWGRSDPVSESTQDVENDFIIARFLYLAKSDSPGDIMENSPSMKDYLRCAVSRTAGMPGFLEASTMLL